MRDANDERRKAFYDMVEQRIITTPLELLFDSMMMRNEVANAIHHIDEIARISGIKPIRVCELLLQTYQEAEQEKRKPRSPRRCRGVRKTKIGFPTKKEASE
jgi:hypothetical protein